MAAFEGRRSKFGGGGGGGGGAKSIRSRHYRDVGLARVAVRIKTVVVGRSEVVTMADKPAVRGKVDRCAIGNGSLSSLCPIIFGSVRFYHAIQMGPHPM